MASSADVLIIGGGVIGLTTAYFLARDGVRVQLVDQADCGTEASWAGAGILPSGSTAPARQPYDRLRALSIAMFPQLSAELRERTGVDNGHLRSGGLEFPGADAQAAAEEWRGEGVRYETLDAQRLHELEPALAPHFREAFYLPDMAQVRNPWHLRALMAACTQMGVWLTSGCPVQELTRSGNRIGGVQTPQGPLTADKYLVAAGAWSAGLLAQVGWRPAIAPVRGQIALLNPGKPLFRHILCQGKCYLVPRAEGRVLVGSTEEDAGFDKRTTVEALTDLREFAARLAPALAAAPLEHSWAGLRPGSADGLPYLGPVPGLDNLFVAAGHFRSGIQLSPATGLLLKELLLGQPPSVPLEAFRLDR